MGRMLKEIFQAQEGGKAFPYDRRLTDAGGALYSGGGPAAYNDYNGFNAGRRPQTPLTQREARMHLQTYGGTDAIDWLEDAVSFTSTSAASAMYHFEDDKQKRLEVKKNPDDPAGTQLAPDSLIKLFASPNPYMNWEDLCEITLIDFLIVGNAYWVKWGVRNNGQPIALYRMAPDCVKIVPGQFGPDKYLYRLPGAREDTEFTPEQVVQFKRTNPLNPYYGMGIVRAGARALDMELGLTKTMASYYDKQALPSGVVQTERRVPKDVFNKLKAQLRAFYSGGDNAGQLMVLESGLKYQTVSPTAADALFAQMGAWSRDRIFAMFNMNKSLVGIWDGQGDPKIAEWQLLFDRKTMIPLTRRFSNAISRGLTQPGWGVDIKIDYEETQQPDDVLKRAQLVAGLPGVKVKEVRAAAKLPPSTGDKKVDETVLNMPGQNLNANGQGGFPDRNLAGEAGRPPKAQNMVGFATKVPPAAKPGSAAVQPTKGTKAFESVDEILEYVEMRGKALAAADHVHVGELGHPVIPPQDTLHRTRTSQIDALVAQTEDELARAATTLERGLLDAVEGKADDTMYQRVKASKAWATFRDKIASILDDAAQTALSLANVHHASGGLDAAEIDYDPEAKSIVYRKHGGVADVLKTIKDRVLARVLKAQQQSKPQTDLEAAIREGIQQWQAGNASAIALDTASFAYNEGTLQVAEANGSNEVLVSDGEDFDQPCKMANGATWAIETARANMSEHPRCRRAFVPLLPVTS